MHTQYSLLDGAARIHDLVGRARELKMDALAITDHGVLYGVIDFYKACKAAGIKPIIGMEAYVAPKSYLDRDNMRDYAHLILLAKNETGYKNLMRLSSISFIDGFYFRPRIDYDLLQKHSEGLICTSACLAGDIPSLLLNNKDREAKELAKRLSFIFKDDFYIELQNHGLPEQVKVLPKLDELAKELGIKTVAANDIHYVNKEDAPAQDALLCIQTNRFVDEEDRMKMSADEFYLKSAEEMREALFDYPESLESTAEIADKCNVEIRFGERHMPGFQAPPGLTNAQYLRKLCYEGLERKFTEPEAVCERLDYELGVVESMGFVDYFLIVWDFIHYAKTHGIAVGPGRGSGAGSVAAYCLDITDVDPIKYDLLFERFLNPDRISMPDFDIDFCYERRQEVIDYVVEKYGADHVAQIITFGSMAARAAIRDVGRVLRMPYGEVDRIAKMIPGELNITIARALEISTELRDLYDRDEQVKKLIDLARKLEGLPRHASTHAAGVVISALPTAELVPLQKNDEAVTTQFPMGTLEELGLLKMDFLGLRTLTVIRDALDFIRQGGHEVPDFSRMEFDDPGVYELMSRGDTDGVFQFESSGMRLFLNQLKPDCFEDIIAGISLYRPGPMEQIPRYIEGKNDPASVHYEHELLKPILKKTYGCMVYQEQVMQIVRDLAGYSLGRSDLVRRAMAKKKHDVMAKERQYFISGIEKDGKVIVPGALKNGVSRASAERIFDEMMEFASYAFNKSHAAAYAVLAYRTAYLKLHYPVEFMTALINSFLGSPEKIAEYIYSCNQSGIKILPPDINKSMPRFSVEGENIRFGLAAVRNVGEGAIGDIVKERDKNGPFTDFYDFLRRSENINKRMVEGLIKSGCFDCFKVRRSQLMAVHESAVASVANDRKNQEDGQISLFDVKDVPAFEPLKMDFPNIKEYDTKTLLSMEKEALGVYISGHPLHEYRSVLSKMSASVIDVVQADGKGRIKDNDRIRLGGLVTGVKKKATKSGNGMMGFVTLEDLTGSIELTVFPTVLQKFSSLLEQDSAVCVSGRVSMREDQANTVVADEVVPLSSGMVSQKLYLKLKPGNATVLPRLKQLLQRFPGNIPVIIYDEESNKKMLVPKEYYVNATSAFLDLMDEMLGRENVKTVDSKQ